MNYEEFKNEVVDRIKEFLPEKYAEANVSIVPVTKNNDTVLDGLQIKSPDTNIAPNIYLNDFYANYEDGRPMDELLEQLASIRVEHEPEQAFDTTRITDFEKAKENITCRLVNAENNADYLADKPHTMVSDLAVTYHIDLGNDGYGSMSAPITNRIMEQYGVDVEQLHQVALENMETLSPAHFVGMSEMMMEMMGREQAEMFGITAVDPKDERMFVLSNESKQHGAAVLLNEKAMDQVAETVGKDFYILPSSIHEVLIVPKQSGMELADLTSMVNEVNAVEVAPNEVLSDHVYTYDTEAHKLLRADQAQEMEKETIEQPASTEQNKVEPEKITMLRADQAQEMEKETVEQPASTEQNKVEPEKITISITSKLVGEPFKAKKDGNEYIRVKIPNADKNDHSPWSSFVVTPDQVSQSEQNGKVDISLMANATITTFKPILTGADETGKPLFENERIKVTVKDLKTQLEGHREKHNIKGMLNEIKDTMAKESADQNRENKEMNQTEKKKNRDQAI